MSSHREILKREWVDVTCISCCTGNKILIPYQGLLTLSWMWPCLSFQPYCVPLLCFAYPIQVTVVSFNNLKVVSHFQPQDLCTYTLFARIQFSWLYWVVTFIFFPLLPLSPPLSTYFPLLPSLWNLMAMWTRWPRTGCTHCRVPTLTPGVGCHIGGTCECWLWCVFWLICMPRCGKCTHLF